LELRNEATRIGSLPVSIEKDFLVFHAWWAVAAARSMREADVAADVRRSWLNCSVLGVQAGPVATQMRQMPLVAYKAIFLLLCQSVQKQFGDDAKVEDN
jgi:hypothetical protein